MLGLHRVTLIRVKAPVTFITNLFEIFYKNMLLNYWPSIETTFSIILRNVFGIYGMMASYEKW